VSQPDGLPMTEALMRSWDDLSAAIDRVLTAQPGQMTAAAERLEVSRREHRALIWSESQRLLKESKGRRS
jgi:hypothetical protein